MKKYKIAIKEYTGVKTRNNEKIEITKTDLRSLMFWASAGIEKHWGGSYTMAKEYIQENNKIMPKHLQTRCKKLEFGKRLK